MSGAESVAAKLGPGSGTQIGITDDLKVFVAIESKDKNGEPCQTVAVWEPETATKIGTHILDAARQAIKAGDEADGRPDGIRTN